MSIEFTTEIELTIKLSVDVIDFLPARQAPACSNPDSPHYSDPGDDCEFDIKEISLISVISQTPFIKKGKSNVNIDPIKFPESFWLSEYADKINEEIEKYGEELCTEEYE